MPMNRADYPPDWEEISNRIRFERAGGRCECDGRCGISHEGGRCEAVHGASHPETGSVVWLTTAHLNHDTKDNRDSNLMAMCQQCHLSYDKDHHLATRRATLRQRQLDAGQLVLAL